MGTLKGKVQRLATVGLVPSSTIQSMSFFSRIAMLLTSGLNGCQSWMMVELGRTPCIRSVVRYSRWIAVWSRRTGAELEVDTEDWLSPTRPSSERRSLRSSALKRTSSMPCRGEPACELTVAAQDKNRGFYYSFLARTCLVMIRYFWKSLGPSWSSRVRRATLTSGYLALTSSAQKRSKTPATPFPLSWGATRRPSTSMVSPSSITHTDSRAIYPSSEEEGRQNITNKVTWSSVMKLIAEWVVIRKKDLPLFPVCGPVWLCGWFPAANWCT